MKRLVIFTGAGISAESGLATFRDKNGLWTNEEWERLAHKDSLVNETQKCLNFYNWRRTSTCVGSACLLIWSNSMFIVFFYNTCCHVKRFRLACIDPL